MSSVKILIDIRSEANLVEIIECIRETFKFMPGWSMSPNVLYGGIPLMARMYCFNLDIRSFAFWRPNDSYSDTIDGDEYPITNIADISILLNFIYDNEANLRTPKPEFTEEQKAGMAHFASLFEKEKGIEDIDLETGKWKDECVTPSLGKSNYGDYIYQMLKKKMAKNNTEIVIPKVKNSIDDNTWWNVGGKSLKYDSTLIKIVKNAELKIPPKIKWTPCEGGHESLIWKKEIGKVMSGESDANDIYEYYMQSA